MSMSLENAIGNTVSITHETSSSMPAEECVKLQFIVINLVLFGIATVVFALRLFARSTFSGKFTLDDWIMIHAWAQLAGCEITLIIGTQYGIGRHIYNISSSEFESLLKVFFAILIQNVAASSTIKIFILVFYLRIGGNTGGFYQTTFGRTFRRVSQIVLVLVIISGLAQLLILFFQCRPVYFGWSTDRYKVAKPDCMDITTLCIGGAAINIITDGIIFLLPCPLYWRLSGSILQKIGLCLTFLTGFLTLMFSMGRVMIDVKYVMRINTDPSYTVQPLLWAMAKLCFGVISASIPALKPMFVHVRRRSVLTESRSGSNSGSDTQTSRNKPRPQHPFYDLDIDAYINKNINAAQMEHDISPEEVFAVQCQSRRSMRISILQMNPLRLLRQSTMTSSSGGAIDR